MKIDFETCTHHIISSLGKYLDKNNASDVLNYNSANSLQELVNLEIPQKSNNFEDFIEKVEEYLKYTPRTTHPLFVNQLNGGFNYFSFIGDLVTHLTNTSMATYEIAPMATLIEKELIKKIATIVGYDHKLSEGIMLTGGSNANMMAIHCARNKYDPELKNKGNGDHNFKIFVSNQAHYSFKKAVIICGLGLDSLIQVESDSEGRMCPSDLEQKIKKETKNGATPLLVASTFGTTVYGSIDPIDEISKICSEFKLWHHIDGAWGGPLLFLEESLHYRKVTAHSDSYTWDAHKLMGTGLITSFFLTKHKGILFQSNSGGGNKYLFHENENADYDTGHMSLQCGRKVDCLKLWFAWQAMGDEGFIDLVRSRIDLRKYFVEKLNQNKKFQIIHAPEFLNVCFQVIPENAEEINQFNLALRYKVLKSGKAMINFSSDKGKIFFRMVFANNQTTEKDIDRLIDIILDAAN